MSEQSAADSGARLPFAGTTSDGQAADVRPRRPIKPPSNSFLSQRSDESGAIKGVRLPTDVPGTPPLSLQSAPLPSLDPAPAPPPPPPPPPAPVAQATPAPEPRSAPAMELSGPAPAGEVHDLLSGPAPTAPRPAAPARPPEPEAAPAPAPPPPPATFEARPGETEEAREARLEAKAQSSYTSERLQAEVRELDKVVTSIDTLSFLRPRVKRSIDEGLDAITLVSFYRLTTQALLDEVNRNQTSVDQIRREMELSRSKASRMELELATAQSLAPKPAAAGPDANQSARITALEAERDQANEQREKLLVDFKNSRDRAQRDLELKIFKEKEKFFRNFLPVLDSFERASQTMNEQAGAHSLVAGFQMISGQLAQALKEEGLDPVDTSGLFDPRFHEAVGYIETQEKADEHIYDVLSTGYQVGERLIRPAMVRVARNASGVIVPPAGGTGATQE